MTLGYEDMQPLMPKKQRLAELVVRRAVKDSNVDCARTDPLHHPKSVPFNELEIDFRMLLGIGAQGGPQAACR